ncbi:hypothetical protein, partial [Methylobacterium sp. WL18]|uniref:hypothetical protein n=1 Tax=Methylobacterium sp. WL18 TaxID=2603897 RepID=UPI001AEE5658
MLDTALISCTSDDQNRVDRLQTARNRFVQALLTAVSLAVLCPAAMAQPAMLLDELSVEARGGTAPNAGSPPPGGT